MSYCCRFAHTLFLNLPIVSYYQAGTQITPTHGHAALMGVFGMLAIALMVFCLRQASSDARWPGIEKYVKVAFWGTNIGLAPMILMRLFPQRRDAAVGRGRAGYKIHHVWTV